MRPEEAKEKFAQADRLYRDGAHAQAIALLEELGKAYPHKPNVLLLLARCLAKVHREEEAARLCDQLIETFQDTRALELKMHLLDRDAPATSLEVDGGFDFEQFDVSLEDIGSVDEGLDVSEAEATSSSWVGSLIVSLVVVVSIALAYLFLFG